MASRSEAIVDAIIARLQLPEDLDPVPEPLEGLVVDDYPLRPGKGSRIRVYPFDEKVSSIGGQLVRRELLVKVEVLRSPIDEGSTVRRTLDPLYVWCIQRLLLDRKRGNTGALGGLADWLEERGRGWGGDEKEEAWARMVIDVAVAFRTRADDPEKRA